MTVRTVDDGQLGQLARKQNDLFRRVREGTIPIEQVLGSLQDLIEGNFDAVPKGPRRLIDCDTAPYIPDGWKVEEHQQGGQIEFDPKKIAFHLDDAQKKGTIVGNDLKKKLAGKPVLNACVLDHLLANTNLIPDSWKTDEKGQERYIYFWGTFYRSSDDDLYVRCLYFFGGQWHWSRSWLGSEFGAQSPAAVLAS